MRVTWEVNDGYVGKSRPQVTNIPDSHFEGLSESEIESEIDEYVAEDFHQNITYSIMRIDKD